MDRQADGSGGDVREQDPDPDPWRDVEVFYEHAMRCRGRGDVEGACRLFEQVIDSGSAVPAQRAAFEIGKLLAKQKDWAGARDAYLKAADLAADAKVAERAEIEAALAVSMLAAASKEVARWRTIASSKDKKAAAEAAYRVGVMLADRGEVRAARAAYRRAIASGDPFAASRAWERLGRDLADEGDRDGLVAAWRAAIAVSDPDDSARIAVNLAVRLRLWGKDAEARTAAEFALTAASGHPEHMPRAQYELGIQLHNAGDLDGARVALQAAVDSDHPVTAPRAKAVLGSVLYRMGEHEQGQALLNTALASGDPEAVEIATIMLGTYLERAGDLANAEASYRRAAAAASSPKVGALHLGRLLIRRGRPVEAEDWLRKAAEADLLGGCADLGRLLQSQDRLDDAEPWFRRALDQGDTSVLTALADLLIQRHQPQMGTAARAHGLLGRAFIAPIADPFPVSPGVLDEAEQLYRRAIDAGDRGAPVGLGTILFASGRLDEAEECLRAAADAGDTQA
ncbi:MAG TPA: tetratricopeptide repeat protein [Actinocrinis sp.]